MCTMKNPAFKKADMILKGKWMICCLLDNIKFKKNYKIETKSFFF